MMRYWVFHEQALVDCLALREAERIKEGATEQQAKDETVVIVQFLASPVAQKLRGDHIPPKG